MGWLPAMPECNQASVCRCRLGRQPGWGWGACTPLVADLLPWQTSAACAPWPLRPCPARSCPAWQGHLHGQHTPRAVQGTVDGWLRPLGVCGRRHRWHAAVRPPSHAGCTCASCILALPAAAIALLPLLSLPVLLLATHVHVVAVIVLNEVACRMGARARRGWVGAGHGIGASARSRMRQQCSQGPDQHRPGSSTAQGMQRTMYAMPASGGRAAVVNILAGD